jgi:hypothetical protein
MHGSASLLLTIREESIKGNAQRLERDRKRRAAWVEKQKICFRTVCGSSLAGTVAAAAAAATAASVKPAAVTVAAVVPWQLQPTLCKQQQQYSSTDNISSSKNIRSSSSIATEACCSKEGDINSSRGSAGGLQTYPCLSSHQA